MKKNTLRLITLIAALIAALSVLSGCMMGGQMPSVTNEEKDVTTPYAERTLAFVQNTAAAQVNVDTPLGFFCYKDNQFRILTSGEKTDEKDRITELELVVYNGRKNEDGSNTAVGKLSEDGSNKLEDGVDYVYSIKENGYLYLNSRVLGDVEITNAKCANGSSLDSLKFEVAPHSVTLFDIIIGAMGLYLLYSAIVGKGKLFSNDFIKEGMEDKHKRIVRITSLVIGVLMLAAVAVALLDTYGRYRIATLIIFGVVFAAFIVSSILLRSCTDLEAKRKAMNDRYAAGPIKTPASAFVFDDDEPTVDDIKGER